MPPQRVLGAALLRVDDGAFFLLSQVRGTWPELTEEEARFLLAAKLYELGKLTSGQAACLCGNGLFLLLNLPGYH
jgi:hypothetical protein